MIRRISSANSVPDPFGAPPGHHTVTYLSDHPLADPSTRTAKHKEQINRNSMGSTHSRNPSLANNAQSISSGLNVHPESSYSISSGELTGTIDGGGVLKNSSPSNVSVPSFMSTSPLNNFGSILNELPIVFKSPPSEQLICSICRLIFADPVISQCGHTFCRRCVGDNNECPFDSSSLSVVANNLAVSDQISNTEIYCRYGLDESDNLNPDGCSEVIKLGSRSTHESVCEYVFVSCPNNPQNCPKVRKINIESHLLQCEHRRCPNHVFTCNYVGTLDEVHAHVTNGDCKYEGIKSYLSGKEKEMDTFKQILNEKNAEIVALKSEVSRLSELLKRLDGKFMSKMKTLEGNYFGSIEQVNEMRRSIKTLNDEVSLINAKLSTGDLGPYDPQHQYKCRGTFVGHESDIWCLITCGDILITGSSDKTIKVWDKCSSFKCLHSLESHSSAVLSLHSCGKFLYSGSADGILIVWDLDSFEQLKVLPASEYGIGAIATGGDKTTMLFVGSQNFIAVYNFSAPWELKKRINMPPMTAQWVKALKTNEKHLFCGTSGQIKIYDITKDDALPCIKTLTTQFGYIYSLDLTSKLLVAGCQNGKVLIYDPSTFELKGKLEGHVSTVHAVAILQITGSTRIFSASQDRSIRVWSLERMICTQNLIRHNGAVTCITVSRGLIFSGSCDASVKVWQ